VLVLLHIYCRPFGLTTKTVNRLVPTMYPINQVQFSTVNVSCVSPISRLFMGHHRFLAVTRGGGHL